MPLLIAFLIGLLITFLPTITAMKRKTANKGKVLLINLFQAVLLITGTVMLALANSQAVAIMALLIYALCLSVWIFVLKKAIKGVCKGETPTNDCSSHFKQFGKIFAVVIVAVAVIAGGSIGIYSDTSRSKEKCVNEFKKAVNTNNANTVLELSITTSIDAEKILERYSEYDDLEIEIESEEELNYIGVVSRLMTDEGLKEKPVYGVRVKCSFTYKDSSTGEDMYDTEYIDLLRSGNKYYIMF